MKIGITCSKEWKSSNDKQYELVDAVLNYYQEKFEDFEIVVNSTSKLDTTVIQTCFERGINCSIIGNKHDSWIHANLDLIDNCDRMGFIYNGSSSGVLYTKQTAEYLGRDTYLFTSDLNF